MNMLIVVSAETMNERGNLQQPYVQLSVRISVSMEMLCRLLNSAATL
jgi:hypothetical protein